MFMVVCMHVCIVPWQVTMAGYASTCACNVYQALFSPPFRKGPGYEANFVQNHTATILTPIHWSTDYFIIVLSV